MVSQQADVKGNWVTTEGDDLYYEVRGQGKPLLMIPGGGGDGQWYSAVADILSEEYKVITYDRRANARSTMNQPQNFEISQQSRDAVAVLQAVGETSAFVFGNSSGAVIAIDMAVTQPQAVRAVIAHEPPMSRAHPNPQKWQRFFASIYWTAFRFSTTLALLRFITGVHLPVRDFAQAAKNAESATPQVKRLSREDTSYVLAKLELLPITNYLPNLEVIRKQRVKLLLAAGRESLDKKRFYAETAASLARQLGEELVIFPGHHLSFVTTPQEWALTLRQVLHKADALTPMAAEV